MKKKVIIIIASVFLLAGIGLVLYPPISNYFGGIKAEEEISSFNDLIGNVVENNPEIAKHVTSKTFKEAREKGEVDDKSRVVDENGYILFDFPVIFKADLERLYNDSKEYNKNLINNQGTIDTSDYGYAPFDMSEYGLTSMYGYMEAPAIKLKLPIYLGASDLMMSYGAAHLYGTSLPLDEKDTNVAIAGHTGYIGRIFFDYIRDLNIGDSVSITTYWETIEYTVIDFKEITAYETDDIYIKPGRQLLTLITCQGSNRYVVICEKT